MMDPTQDNPAGEGDTTPQEPSTGQPGGEGTEGAGEEQASPGGAQRDGKGRFQSRGGGDTVGDPAPEPQGADWRRELPEDLAKAAEKFNSPTDVLKSYRELESKLGRSVALPGKDATPEQIADFRKKALGVPDDPSGYEVKLPEDLPDELKLDDAGQKRLDDFRRRMHEAGAPPSAVQAANDFYYEMLIEGLQEQERKTEETRNQTVEELQREWRDDYDVNVNYARRAIKAFDLDQRFGQFVENAKIDGHTLGNHPEFMRLFATIGRKMSEDTLHLSPDQNEQASLNKQIDKIREQKEDARAKGNLERAMQLDEEERQIYVQLSGNAPAVGTSGRVV